MRWFCRRRGPGLMRLEDALAALGEDGTMSRGHADVPVANIVGTLERPYDFDQDFRLINSALTDRWNRLATAMRSGFEPPPVELVRLGDLYFVADGHHRVSVARSLGRLAISAKIRRVCTIAYAMACLRVTHLPSKAAECHFLQRIPLPEAVRTDLWLDEPADWMRLADSAEAWALRSTLDGRTVIDREHLADTWWSDEVLPVLAGLRVAGIGTNLRDVQLYVTALAARDQLDSATWPNDIAARLGALAQP